MGSALGGGLRQDTDRLDMAASPCPGPGAGNFPEKDNLYFVPMEHPHTDSDASEAMVPLNDVLSRLLIENQAAFKGFLRKHLPSEELADDLLQQSLLKAIRHGDDLSGKESVVAWFYRILRNSLIDFYRSRASEGRKQEGLLHEVSALGHEMHPGLDEELHREVCTCLNRLLPSLKPEYSELIRRIDLDGEDPARVAEALGITYNNTLVRLHRARQALRKSLEHSCGACTRHGCLDCTCAER